MAEGTHFFTIDHLLSGICVRLQLTKTQYWSAEEHYLSIGGVLSEKPSPLAPLVIRIYPQGSMALETTVKPRDEEEFDLDLILLFGRWLAGPVDLRNAVIERLRQDARYRDRLDLRFPRCIRVNYAGQFHLDVVPARVDVQRGGTAIEVPDKGSSRWMPNDPLKYKALFDAASKYVILEKAAQDPLPLLISSDDKPPLKRAVQLLKRHRDVVFKGASTAPSSMVLTTLAARYYRAESSVAEALQSILKSILRDAQLASPGRMSLPNPGNDGECLMREWTDERYNQFIGFVSNFAASIDRLLAQAGSGLPAIGSELKKLFDEEGTITNSVLNEFAKSIQEQRLAGQLKATTSGLALGVGRTIPRNTHYGR